MDILTAHEGDSDGLVTSVDWKHGTWVDGHLCQSLHIHVAQLGYCDYHAFLLHMFIICANINHLAVQIPDHLFFSAG
jgi:hypothetical protein